MSVPGLSEVVEISAGERTSCARTKAGALYDWGANAEGQIGNGEAGKAVSTPYKVPLPGAASEVSCGGNLPSNGHTLALVAGEVYGWGADAKGQIGDGKTYNKLSPVPTGLYFSQVVASGASSYGLEANGHVFSWGSGFDHSLGRAGKEVVPGLVDEGVVAVSGTAHDAIDLH